MTSTPILLHSALSALNAFWPLSMVAWSVATTLPELTRIAADHNADDLTTVPDMIDVATAFTQLLRMLQDATAQRDCRPEFNEALRLHALLLS
ncbi:hypothetical protein [Leifsonia aquatica]|uniref:hypothetical protein n=1 Tax=Leifsonia aquatica TaxID=144185 RepID=UPI00046A3636|nr:hypothetical protein [Leifsonia aquatica]